MSELIERLTEVALVYNPLEGSRDIFVVCLYRLRISVTTAGDRFIYDQTTGNFLFDADEISKAAQVQITQFSNQAMLTNVNITVIA
ncbi:hypothetical protein [Nostoc sp.]|uniref:hypothetical protein n=1 Tax=Nostoc sp. TaxID=1180 RepID=UPI002FFA8A77